MAEPSAATMSTMFSELTGRRVAFIEQLHTLTPNASQIYSSYLIKPMDTYRVVKADLPLLGSFAGALIGLPDETIKERLKQSNFDDGFKDAMDEVMNIASRIVVTVERRAVFTGLYQDPGLLPPAARETLRHPSYSGLFNVKIEGYEGGRFTLLASD